ncbi:DNA binding domain protein [Erwinia phage AH03]|uniref:DNA binding domain protein n=1 Tax=Erwinia phage AH03 TaxID=2869568 RepID=A0AAE8BQ81_9CAUD|nr:DNA binding domain protein [Erwinia phage AH03]
MINNPLPEPKDCDHCNSTRVVFLKNHIKTERDSYVNAWWCRDCSALVSCHPGSRIPLGYMTDREGRRLRKLLHLTFDILWQHKYMTRDEAYCWLATALLKSRDDAHISRLSKAELRQAMVLCEKEVEFQKRVFERRKDKAQNKRNKDYAEHRKSVIRRQFS